MAKRVTRSMASDEEWLPTRGEPSRNTRASEACSSNKQRRITRSMVIALEKGVTDRTAVAMHSKTKIRKGSLSSKVRLPLLKGSIRRGNAKLNIILD
ncbi:hypothetical protein Ocin01_18872 [Orchesella cincta]|uniref:Uncharacterized protein n=1 Tax=Orchesella cincta TaxID=48709 RepID=A0A1D2M4A5_ORCCI|nr:hypothetical protein Ocin01_18872 [Orchesella cincta]